MRIVNLIFLLFIGGCALNNYSNLNNLNKHIIMTSREEKLYKKKFEKLDELAKIIISKRKNGTFSIREEKIFFRKFPSTFKEFICIYGYIYDDMEIGGFTSESGKGGIGVDFAKFHIEDIFSNLNMDEDKIIKKIIKICKDGYWQADGLNYLINSSLIEKLDESKFKYENFLRILNKLNNEELKRFWMVYSEPAGYKDTNIFRYEKLYPRVVKAYREVLEYIDSFEECK